MKKVNISIAYEEEKYAYNSNITNEYWICSNLNNSNNKWKC